ncbi:TetR/AcrR family transcriptional regulator [Amaricoccus tamworthensis]|uniref:TetR/AcrR family transcriptional regulator n=1 Tax=Amaricoccus tamworthensis TaxID=57002 RepID=UPI003C7C0E00
MVIPSEERRDRVLDALDAVYAKHGMAGTTMDAIAAEAGMSKSTLYRLFSDRDALFRAHIERIRSSHVRPLKVEDRALPIEGRLRKLLTPDPAIHHSGLPIAVLRHVISHEDGQAEIGQACVLDMILEDRALIREVLDEGVERGEVEISDTESAAALLQSMIKVPLLELLLRPGVLPDACEMRERFELGLGVFLTGIGARRAA